MSATVLTILERCRISPPANTIGKRSLPLTFFDLPWLMFDPVHLLYFYDFSHSESYFIDTVIPKLKHSLSITLQHFFPFASNLILFPREHHSAVPRKPEIHHVDDDSVAVTFAECHLDFNDLKGNHRRDCNKFHPLVPPLETASEASVFLKIPVFAVQVTIFPNSGITIGLTNHHSLCDARTTYDFLMSWTSIAKHGTDELFLASASLPFYDRVINYPKALDDIVLNAPPIQAIDGNYKVPQLVLQADRVRSTIVLTRSQIDGLKKWLLVQLPTLKYVSSFAVGCGYAWSCIAKSRVLIDGEKGEYEVERFACMVDWRTRLHPPVPETYFGNCTGLCMAATKTTSITGTNGFPTAVELLGTAIMEAVSNKEKVFQDAERCIEKAAQQVPTIGVAGTPKQNAYDVDFGWGRPSKYETVSLDFNNAISVNAGKESSQDLEIGLCLPAKQMGALITIHGSELKSMLSDRL